MSTGRNTTIRDRHRKQIAHDQPPCGICGNPINYELPHTDPNSYVVDHIIPINKGGADALANKQAAHRQHGDATDSNPTAYPTTYNATTSPHEPGDPPNNQDGPGSAPTLNSGA